MIRPTAEAGSVSRPQANKWVIAVTVAFGAFMAVMDVSVVNVSLPHMMGSFGQDLSSITWVATSYSIAEIIMVTMSGWCSTLIGRKRFYLWSFVLFTFGSILCGTARSFPHMLATVCSRGRATAHLYRSPRRFYGRASLFYYKTINYYLIIKNTSGFYPIVQYHAQRSCFLQFKLSHLKSLCFSQKQMRERVLNKGSSVPAEPACSNWYCFCFMEKCREHRPLISIAGILERSTTCIGMLIIILRRFMKCSPN